MNSSSSHAAGSKAETSTLEPQPTTLPDLPRAETMPPQVGEPGGRSCFVSVEPTHRNIAYTGLSLAQKLDLYLPVDDSGPFPPVIMVRGGAFAFGDKADGGGLAGVNQLLVAGYAVASINYRLSGE